MTGHSSVHQGSAPRPTDLSFGRRRNQRTNLSTATKLFSQTIAAMSGTVLEGLAATSHNTSALCTVTMDSVSVS